MANGGWYGSREEWDRLEAPLLAVDETISRFAASRRLDLAKNQKDCPGRSLSWGSDPSCLIQLFLADEPKSLWNLWIVCSQDRDLQRYWKQAMIVSAAPMDAFAERLPDLLEVSFSTLESWRRRPDELEFAASIARLPGQG